MALPQNHLSTQPAITGRPRKSLAIFLPNLSGGGAERSHLNMATAFVAAGYDVTFLLYRSEGELLSMLPASVQVVALGNARSLMNLWPLRSFLRRARPDYLIANLGHNNIIAVWAAMLARTSTKIIVSEHNVFALDCADKPPWDWRYKILPLLYRCFIGHAAAIVAVSDGVADALAAYCGITRSRITVISNPVITEDFDRNAAEPASHPWLQPGEPPLFLGVGRFIPVKDFATLISAFAIVARQTPARLILLGEGGLRSQLAAQADREGVADRIDMPGYQLNPLPFMRAATALVLSSRHEGFANVLVEALACGTQVISTDCPYGPAEILANGQYGRLVAVGDKQAMAQAMLNAIKHPDVDSAPRRQHAATFTVQNAAKSYIRLFDGLNGQSNRAEAHGHDIFMVGQFPEDAALIKGGVQASTYGLSRALQLQPHLARSLRVLALPLKPQTQIAEKIIDGIAAKFLNAPYKFLASSIVHLPKTLRLIRSRADPVVHVHGTGLFQAALCALARWKRLPLVWTLHGITEKENLMQWRARPSVINGARYLLYRFLERGMLRLTPDIIVDTPYVRHEVPPTRNRVHVIPQGIFMNELVPLRDRERDPNLILSLGVMAPRKGHHLLLEAFATLRRRVPQARLIIAGALAIPEYARLLERKAQELGIADAVEIRVNLPRTEILDLLGQAQIFALHSEEESQGIALCEALAVGLPIVATRIGGIPFVVDEGVDGILTPFGDIAGFSDGMARLLSDPALHAQMAAAARVGSARFDWLNIAVDVTQVYALAKQASGHA